MFVSKTKQGEWFSLVNNHSPEHLRKLRQKESFFCPECKEQVILKIGTKKLPHFAHRKGTACSESYERESEYHLKGKLLLFEWLQSTGVNTILEPYIKAIAQRPDIGFIHDGIEYAIEYQCSVIPEELFLQRTKNYRKINIIPIWIMAGKNIKRKGNYRVALSGFDYLFLRKSHCHEWMISAFCPITNNLIIMNDITPISAKNIITQFSITNLKNATLSDLLNPKCIRPFMIKEWQTEIRKLKNTKSLYGTLQNKFLQELYTHAFIPFLLPPEIGLPVSHAPYIETPIVEWQSYLFIDVLWNKEWTSKDKIVSSFKRRVNSRDVKLRRLSLHPDGNALLAVKEYIKLLETVKILQSVDNKRLIKVNSVIVAENLDQQLEREKSFYWQYRNMISKSMRQSENIRFEMR